MCAIRSPLSEIRPLFSPMLLSSVAVLVSVLLSLVRIWFRNSANSAFVGDTNQAAPAMTPVPNTIAMPTMATTAVAGSFHRVRNSLHVFLPDVLVSSVT